MTIFLWELKKLLRRRTSRVLLVLALLLSAVEPLTLGFANFGFGTGVAAPTWEARARIAEATADAGAWHGPLTPDLLKAARADCRAVVASHGTLEGQTAFVQGNILYRAAEVFTGAGVISWENWPARMTALDDEALGQFYPLWEENARRVIEAAPEGQQAALAALQDRVVLPFTYDWTAGHEAVLTILGNVMYLVGLLLCAAVVPLFCAEHRTGVFPVSRCTRHGRGKLTAAKLAAALAFAGGGFALCMGVFAGLQLVMFGPRALTASLQIADFQSLLPLTLGGAEALLLGAGLLSCLAGAALAATLSAALDAEFPALAALAGLLIFLRALLAAGLADGPLACVARAMPFLASFSDLTGNALVTLPGGGVVPAAYYQLAVLPLWLVVLLPLAGRLALRRTRD